MEILRRIAGLVLFIAFLPLLMVAYIALILAVGSKGTEKILLDNRRYY